MIKNVIFIVLSLLLAVELSSQQVVISEFNNAATASNQWTELFVIQDNLDMRGFILRDANLVGNVPIEWNSGIKFTDNDLWAKVAKGTVIVIWHRSRTALVTPDAGYIEIGSEDSRFFDRLNWDNDKSLNLTGTSIADDFSDIMQILDKNGNHIHSLSNILATDLNASLYSSITSNSKVNHSKEPADFPYSLEIIAANLSDYSSGSGTAKTSDRPGDSRGFPNVGKPEEKDVNHPFWQSIRQVNWAFQPQLQFTTLANGVLLNWSRWNSLGNQSEYTGYLVLRMPSDKVAEAQKPLDGRIYNTGQTLGSAVVLANVSNSDSPSYLDQDALACGSSYTYQIFVYRFDNGGFAYEPEQGRGRAYNETTFIQANYTKTTPTRPSIAAVGGITQTCIPNTIKLYAITNDNSQYRFSWSGPNGFNLAFQGIGVNDTIEAPFNGEYTLRISNEYNCENASIPFNINILDKPNVVISNNNFLPFNNDTTLQLCQGQTFILRGIGGITKTWYRSIEGNTTAIDGVENHIVNRAGTYFVVGKNGDCSDTSKKVTIVYSDIDFATDKNQIVYNLSEAENTQVQSFSIINNSNDELIVNRSNIIVPNNFAITTPVNFPNVIAPQGNLTIQLTYTFDGAANVIDTIKLRFACDNNQDVILNASKAISSGSMAVNLSRVVFPISIYPCQLTSKDTIVKLSNTSNTSMSINIKDNLARGFQINSLKGRIALPAQTSLDILVSFTPTIEGIFRDTLEIENESNPNEKILVVLNAQVQEPILLTNSVLIKFEEVYQCNVEIDTTIQVSNPTDIPIIISNQIPFPGVELFNLPISVNPGQTVDLTMRVNVNIVGEGTVNLGIYSNPCSRLMPITFEIEKKEFTPTWPESIILDNLVICDDKLDSVEIEIPFNIGLEYEGQLVNVVDIVSPFLLEPQFQIGDKLNGGQTLKFKYYYNNSVNLNSFFTIILDPCQQILTIPVIIRVEKVEMSLSNVALNFGNLENGEFAQRQLEILNESNIEVTIDTITLDNPAFRIVNNVSFPLIVNNSNKVLLNIEYSCIDAGNIEGQLVVKYSNRCAGELTAKLTAMCQPENEVQVVKAILPSSLIHDATATIKVDLFLDNGKQQFKNDISKAEIMLEYDPEVFIGRSFFLSNELVGTFSNYSAREQEPGKFFITFDMVNPTNILSGKWGHLDLFVLNATPNLPIIKVESVNLSAGRTDFIYDLSEGQCNVDLSLIQCELNQRNIKINGTENSLITNLNVGNKTLNCNVSIPFDEKVEIALVNTLGFEEIVFSSNQTVSTELNYDVSKLSSGIYFIILKNNSYTETHKVMILE